MQIKAKENKKLSSEFNLHQIKIKSFRDEMNEYSAKFGIDGINEKFRMSWKKPENDK